ncbi:MAG: hypothetical protein EBZ78_03920 [Verrucomicrobia bacterium]|nr:hypothetical protein [Verrucomicrobiota bacterium]
MPLVAPLPFCGHSPLINGVACVESWICSANNPFQSEPATTKDCSHGVNRKAVRNTIFIG